MPGASRASENASQAIPHGEMMDKHPHTVRSYEEELKLLTGSVAEMARISEAQLENAVQALARRDGALAETVIRGDEQVDRLHRAVDELTLLILAKRQPMALDLRIIVASQRMAASFERIADYAANIARNTLQLDGAAADKHIATIHEMADCALGMLRQIRGAYGGSDPEAAIAAWKSDQRINRLFGELVSLLRDFMSQDTRNIKAGTSLLFIGRCCERIGDHLKNAAEQICYMVSGKSLREQC